MSASNDCGDVERTSSEPATTRTSLGLQEGPRFFNSTGEYVTAPIGEPGRLGTVLLRNRDTGLFYAVAGKWVELKEASSFTSSYIAIETAVGLPEPRLEVVFSFEDPLYDISIPIKQVGRLRL